MDNNTNNSSPISHEDCENRSHNSSNEEECFCRPCRHNKSDRRCMQGCRFVHKNEQGRYICMHNCDITDRPCETFLELQRKTNIAIAELQKLQQHHTELLQQYQFLHTKYVERDQEYIALHDEYCSLKQENNYLHQQLDKHIQQTSFQNNQFAAAFTERNSCPHQPARMLRGGYRGV